jgi:adenosylcobinamide kinase/adenosylcobinamide-phosphate guanylyltransferase
MKKIFYFGGQKSGKSNLAEQRILELSNTNKPYYIATYNNTFKDNEMQQRVQKHQIQRKNNFHTIEESQDLPKVIQKGGTYLIDCLSMWLLNNLDMEEELLLHQLQTLKNIDANIVFVLNDVSSGIIPLENISRRYVDLSGIIGQYVAHFCDEVYEVKMGIAIQIK